MVRARTADHALGLPAASSARTRQDRLPFGSVEVADWVPLTGLLSVSGAVNDEELSTCSR